MLQARREASTLIEFGRKIRARAASPAAALDLLATEPPDFIVWSGVREKRFRLAPESFFVTEGTQVPEVLDFMLQVAFTSAPNVNNDNYADTQPWEFPALHDQIYKTVMASIKADRWESAPASISISVMLRPRNLSNHGKRASKSEGKLS